MGKSFPLNIIIFTKVKQKLKNADSGGVSTWLGKTKNLSAKTETAVTLK